MDVAKQLFADPFGDGPRYRRVKAVLELLDIGRTTLWRRIKAGDIRAKRVAGVIYIDVDSIRQLFAASPAVVPLRSHGLVDMQVLGFEPEEPLPDFKFTAADLIGLSDRAGAASEAVAVAGTSGHPAPAPAPAGSTER